MQRIIKLSQPVRVRLRVRGTCHTVIDELWSPIRLEMIGKLLRFESPYKRKTDGIDTSFVDRNAFCNFTFGIGKFHATIDLAMYMSVK